VSLSRHSFYIYDFGWKTMFSLKTYFFDFFPEKNYSY